MPRPRNAVPSYRKHTQSGQAVVTIRLADGTRRDVLLGRHGSPESRAEYQRVLAQLQTAADPAAAVTGRPDPCLTVNELFLAFWRHAQEHYRRPDGTPTQEVSEYRQTIRVVRSLYGHTPAREFGPLALKAVRQAMVGAGWCRTLVNRRVARVRRAFRWAASEELVPVAVPQALATLAGLQKNRSQAREPEPVGPVPAGDVEKTLPHLTPTVAAMVRVQRLTGMRPGEVCHLRPADIDRTGAVWVYAPPYHKLAYRGGPRSVPIGPAAQAVLAGFEPADPEGYYFSPRRSAEEHRRARTAARKTPRYPSHLTRNNTKRVAAPRRSPGRVYDAASYGTAVARACDRAGVPHWHPNQLRHLFATEVRKGHGLEAAQVLLGHSRADVTQVYAERDSTLAARVAAEIG